VLYRNCAGLLGLHDRVFLNDRQNYSIDLAFCMRNAFGWNNFAGFSALGDEKSLDVKYRIPPSQWSCQG